MSFVLFVAAMAGGGGAGIAAEHGRANRCAALGSDYAAVEGSGACVRIGGRMRVPLGNTAGFDPDATWNAGRASSASLRSDAAGEGAAHNLRVPGFAYPNPMR